MKRMLARFWGLASALLASHSALSSQTINNSISENGWLSISAAGNAERVVEWLTTKTPTKTDEKDARSYLLQGRKALLAGNWSLASKAFGESLIRNPTPESLWQYARAETHMLSEIRMRTQNKAEYADSDLRYLLGFYRSAVAASAVVGTLAPNALGQLQHSADCLQEYVEENKTSVDCEPLKAYGIKPTK